MLRLQVRCRLALLCRAFPFWSLLPLCFDFNHHSIDLLTITMRSQWPFLNGSSCPSLHIPDLLAILFTLLLFLWLWCGSTMNYCPFPSEARSVTSRECHRTPQVTFSSHRRAIYYFFSSPFLENHSSPLAAFSSPSFWQQILPFSDWDAIRSQMCWSSCAFSPSQSSLTWEQRGLFLSCLISGLLMLLFSVHRNNLCQVLKLNSLGNTWQFFQQ